MTLLDHRGSEFRGACSVLSLACLLTLGGISGCEDSAAQHRLEAQRTISTASAEFRKVTAGSVAFGDEHFEQRQRDLNALVGRVGNLANADPGQQAAGGMLAAEALAELASMHLAQAQRLQQLNRQDRREVESLVDAASRLHAQAQGQASITTDAERASLQRERQAAEQALDELQQRIASLEGPIGDRTRSNAEGEAAADQLRADANDLIRRAIELGHSRGFPSFQAAISSRRDADEIDYEIAMRELELDYELQPEHQLAEMRVEHLNIAVQSIRQTLEEFDRLEQTIASDLEKTRQRVRELQQSVSQSMRDLGERIGGDLSEQYEAARSHLERAISQAGQAVGRLRGDQANSARLLHAKLQETFGQSLWAEANAIAEQVTLLSRLVDAGDSVGNAAEYRAQLTALASKRQQLIEEAQAAFSEAEQALGSVTGKAANAVELFRQNLQRAASAVGGGAIGPAPTGTPSAGWDDGAAVATGSMQGFASVQEALTFFSSFDAVDRGQTDRMFAAINTSSPNDAAVVNLMRTVMDSALDLQAAIEEVFGDAAEDLGLGAEVENPRIEYEDEDRATIAYDTPMGGDSIELVNLNGQWLVDASFLTSGMPGADQLDPAMLQQMGNAMSGAFSSLAARVRNGEFASTAQLEQAIGETIMQVMMSAFGQQ